MRTTRVHIKSMELSQSIDSNRWIRQIILYRYKLLIDHVCRIYTISDDQKRALEKRILDVEWMTV